MLNNNTNGYSLADIAAATGNNNNDNGFGGGAWWIIILFLFVFCGWGNGFNNGYANGGANNCGGVYAYAYPANVGGGTVREEIAYGFDVNNILTGIRGVQNGICDGFYAQNTNLLNGFSGVQQSLATDTAAIQQTLTQGFAGLNTVANQNTNVIQQDLNNINIANMQNTNALTAQLNAMSADNASCCCATQRLIEKDFADTNYNLATLACQIKQNCSDNARANMDTTNEGTRSILAAIADLKNSAKDDKIAAQAAEIAALKGGILASENRAYFDCALDRAVNTIRPCPNPAYIVPNPYACNCCNNSGGCCGNGYM